MGAESATPRGHSAHRPERAYTPYAALDIDRQSCNSNAHQLLCVAVPDRVALVVREIGLDEEV
jgi:hypothetical protein